MSKMHHEGDWLHPISNLRIVEVKPEIKELVKQNNGYCPCLIQKNEDTKCICKDFKEQTVPGPCHCGRFEKVAR